MSKFGQGTEVIKDLHLLAISVHKKVEQEVAQATTTFNSILNFLDKGVGRS